MKTGTQLQEEMGLHPTGRKHTQNSVRIAVGFCLPEESAKEMIRRANKQGMGLCSWTKVVILKELGKEG
jgi:hypothetical protein